MKFHSWVKTLSLIVISISTLTAASVENIQGNWLPVISDGYSEQRVGELRIGRSIVSSVISGKVKQFNYTVFPGRITIDGWGTFPVSFLNENLFYIEFENTFTPGAVTLYRRKGYQLEGYLKALDIVGEWRSSEGTASFNSFGYATIPQKSEKVRYQLINDSLLLFQAPDEPLPAITKYRLTDDTLVVKYGSKSKQYLRIGQRKSSSTIAARETPKTIPVVEPVVETPAIVAKPDIPVKPAVSATHPKEEPSSLSQFSSKEVASYIHDMIYNIDDGSYGGTISFSAKSQSANKGSFTEKLKSHKNGKEFELKGSWVFVPETNTIYLKADKGASITWQIDDIHNRSGKTIVVSDSNGAKTVLSNGDELFNW